MGVGRFAWVFCAISLILLAYGAAASVQGVPSFVAVRDNPATFSFTVTNETGSRAAVDIDYLAPTGYDVAKAPGWLGPNETGIVTIKLQPNNLLTGSNYKSLLTVKLGTTTTEKRVNLTFAEAVADTGSGQGEGTGNGAGITGFASLFGPTELPANIFELLFDIALVVIAALLLIAFISRLVKRINTAPQPSADNKDNTGPAGPAASETKNKVKANARGKTA